MTLIERIFVLRRVPGFDQLRDEELLAVAASMTERRYPRGAVVVSAGTWLWHLLVVVDGRISAQDSRTLPPVIGADLLLTNRTSPVTLSADDREGAVCLRMSKGHFFTVVNECPALLVELIRLYASSGGEAGAP